MPKPQPRRSGRQIPIRSGPATSLRSRRNKPNRSTKAQPRPSAGSSVLDRDAIRQACEPIARWWQHTLGGGGADPAGLSRAVSRAKLLGPVPGPLGASLAYIVDGCPDLDYPKVHAAFSRVAAAAGPDGPTPLDLGEGGSEGLPVQLRLDGIDGAAAPVRHRARTALQ